MENIGTFRKRYEFYTFPFIFLIVLSSSLFIHTPSNLFWDLQYHPVVFQGVVACSLIFTLPAISRFGYQVKIGVVDISVSMFLLYNITSGVLLRSGIAYDSITWSYLSFLLIYFMIRFHQGIPGLTRHILYILVALFIVNLLACSLQLLGVMPLDHSSFRITGLFANPGPLGCWIVALVPFFILLFLQSAKMRWLPFVLVLCALGLVMLSGSRTAVISLLISLAFLFFKLWQERFSVRFRYRWIFSVGIITILFAIVLYQINTDSVKGRMLIWKVGTSMWTSAPLIGKGPGSVGSLYNLYQGKYFESCKGTEIEKQLAGTTYVLFNEPLRISIENGLIGIVIFSTIVLRALFVQHTANHMVLVAAQASLLSVIVSGIFSYPFNINAVCCIFFTVLALIANEETSFSNLRLPILFQCMLQVALAVMVFVLINVHSSINIWRSAINSWDYDEYTAITKLHSCSGTLQNNGAYLLNFGGELCKRGYYWQGIGQLKKCSRILNNIYVYNQLGQAYESTANFSAAERSYYMSVHMFPAMLSSRYALFKLYEHRKQRVKQLLIAKEINNMQLKIAAPQAMVIKKEINKFLKLNK